MEKLKVGVYKRKSLENVSTSDAAIKELLEGHSEWEVVAEYEDIAKKGDMQCPGVKAMLNDCREGKIKLVVVNALSAFAREREVAFGIIDVLKENHVNIYSVTDKIDTLDPTGWLQLYRLK